MMDFLCYQPSDSYLPKPGPISFIRILNATSLYKRIDIYSNGYLIGKNLGCKKYTPYFTVPSGTHNINIYPAGKKANLITHKNIILESNSISTLVVSESSFTELFLVPDLKVNKKENYSNVRFVNLSYESSPMDVSIIGQGPLSSNIGFHDITDYVLLPSGKYTLQFKLSEGEGHTITLPNTVLKDEWNYTIYTMGVPDKKPGFQVLILLDGNTYIQQIE